ncbi:MAG TPA: S-methyl-5-thioribose-1-phosphate isomerase [Burkholderiaceae bacterium]|nr:S-methyl-5-thioribose-1-phosphate isomerase [Burkholderiaceae bacterium]
MKVNGIPHRSLWPTADGAVEIIDQRVLPYTFATRVLRSVDDAIDAIHTMAVRGAPLIGVTAAYGLALAMRRDAGDAHLADAHRRLNASRPTAVNLHWALDRMRTVLTPLPSAQRPDAAWLEAARIADEDVELNRAIGAHGARLIAAVHARTRKPVQVLTHCNAGWIATVDFGTALSAIYQAHDASTPVHVWVDETRPRSQGLLTAWELAAHGVPHTLIVDNAGGHLMQHGNVDLVLVGADRVSARGDVANKIGTYLKALAAMDNGVPFYAAVPSPTIDWTIEDGLADIPIEERAASEVREIAGLDARQQRATVRITGDDTPVGNPAFDVTPARLVTGIITERGVIAPNELGTLFPERRRAA